MSEIRPIVIVDYGSQTTQLIARRLREHHALSEIVSHRSSVAEIAARRPRGIILSGGPSSCYVEGAPTLDPALLDLGVPMLGICYGMQLLARALGGEVERSEAHEYGRTEIELDPESVLFEGLPARSVAWMSHGDRVQGTGHGFVSIARTPECSFAAVRHESRPLFGVQFHPEVTHTAEGGWIFRNFLVGACADPCTWTSQSIIERSVAAIRQQTEPDGEIICGLSGGVDSAVVAALCQRAVGERVHCVFVDNGLLRLGEREQIEHVFRDQLGLDLRVADARVRFIDALRGVTDPEEKRKVIGHAFIDVFSEEARSLPSVRFLAQGTLYPDVVESTSPHGGPTAKIKSHHNVGGLPPDLAFDLVEPLRMLFKDEVRRVGAELGLPLEVTERQPFPGPGLAVRIPGEVTEARIHLARRADAIVRQEIRDAKLTRKVWQAFAVLLPVRSVGVMGDGRTYEEVVSVRIVESEDGMTADWARVPYEVLQRIASRIVNEVSGINRVLYDITSKPPGTIEWE